MIDRGHKAHKDRRDHPTKRSKKLDLRKWKGRCRQSFGELGYSSIADFLNDVRGR